MARAWASITYAGTSLMWAASVTPDLGTLTGTMASVEMQSLDRPSIAGTVVSPGCVYS